MQNDSQSQGSTSPIASPEPTPSPASRAPLVIGALAAVIVLLLAVIGCGAWYIGYRNTGARQASATTAATNSERPAPQTSTPQVQALQLEASKNCGNKYANGVLPVGDGKYVTSGPKVGYIYACSQYAQNLATDKGRERQNGHWLRA